MPDCHVGIAGIRGVVIKDVGVEHFRNMYRKGGGRRTEEKAHRKEKKENNKNKNHTEKNGRGNNKTNKSTTLMMTAMTMIRGESGEKTEPIAQDFPNCIPGNTGVL